MVPPIFKEKVMGSNDDLTRGHRGKANLPGCKGSDMGFNLLACDLPRKWLLGEQH